jgi:hypothetical protein
MKPRRSESERFFAMVAKTETCWLWTGYTACSGLPYGSFGLRDGTGRSVPVGAHRWSWAYHHGPIPPGLWVCHTCDVPSCVNPAHLFLGTPRENNDDKIAKGRATTTKGLQLGMRHPHARLTDDQVREMRRLHAEQGFGAKRLAKRYGVGQTTIHRVLTGETWGHVE